MCRRSTPRICPPHPTRLSRVSARCRRATPPPRTPDARAWARVNRSSRRTRSRPRCRSRRRTTSRASRRRAGRRARSAVPRHQKRPLTFPRGSDRLRAEKTARTRLVPRSWTSRGGVRRRPRRCRATPVPTPSRRGTMCEPSRAANAQSHQIPGDSRESGKFLRTSALQTRFSGSGVRGFVVRVFRHEKTRSAVESRSRRRPLPDLRRRPSPDARAPVSGPQPRSRSHARAPRLTPLEPRRPDRHAARRRRAHRTALPVRFKPLFERVSTRRRDPSRPARASRAPHRASARWRPRFRPRRWPRCWT